jgi:hypothetical protein
MMEIRAVRGAFSMPHQIQGIVVFLARHTLNDLQDDSNSDWLRSPSFEDLLGFDFMPTWR